MKKTNTIIINEISAFIKDHKTASAWERGVKEYAVDLVEDLCLALDEGRIKADHLAISEAVNTTLLNGADSWKQYSWGGCSLIYDADIAERLCTKSELKRTNGGQRRPNHSEEWLDIQARALRQAALLVELASKRTQG